MKHTFMVNQLNIIGMSYYYLYCTLLDGDFERESETNNKGMDNIPLQEWDPANIAWLVLLVLDQRRLHLMMTSYS